MTPLAGNRHSVSFPEWNQWASSYRGMTARSLKPKHVDALFKHWFAQDLSIGTIKNRMAVIRWWAQKVDKQNVVASSNEHYGIPDQRFVTNESKAKSVTRSQLDKVRDEHVRMSLELQQTFGLRREAAMKFQPNFADRGDHLVLKASWTKGGRERVIPVRTEGQRNVLDRAHRLAGFGSLIPGNRNYVHQMRVYEGNILRAGLSQMHGLRHAYAQNRYQELTGWKAPAAGGPCNNSLTSEQRTVDREAMQRSIHIMLLQRNKIMVPVTTDKGIMSSITEKYNAVVRKDSTYEGIFFVAVKTTMVFCRPTCNARKPKTENVVFYGNAKEALLNGYRPCKVCRPMQPLGTTPEFIRGILKDLDDQPYVKIRDSDLVKKGIEANLVRRWFKRNHNMTFHTYQRMLRINRAFNNITNGEPVTDAAFDNGYKSLSGFNENYKTMLGKAPTKSDGKGVINITRFTTPLGPMFGCATKDGY